MADILDENNNIRSGLRADIMRRSMETKALLTEKGDLYVGTGDLLESVDGYDLYKTAVLKSPLSLDESKKILTSNVNSDLGLEWSFITSGMIALKSISLKKLANNLVNTDPKTDKKDILTVSLEQNTTNDQIQLKDINFNIESLAEEVRKSNNIISISSVSGVLTIQFNNNEGGNV